ncbi:MAG: DUF6089 family protein [Paludibacteraceae bacterium]
MNVLIRKSVLLSLILLTTYVASWGQDDPYRAEIGVQGGLSLYSGDVNTIADLGLYSENTKNLNSGIGILFRYRFNQRLALRLGYDYTKVKGNYSYKDAAGTYSVALNNPLHIFDLWSEFNFFDLDNNPYKRFSKRFSPFLFVGLGGMLTPDFKSEETNSNFTVTIPFGVGLKWKMGGKWNLNAQVTSRLLMSDNLEGKIAYDNPLPKTISNPLNNDLLTGFSVGFTYDFWMRDCDCPQTISGNQPASQKIKNAKKSKKRK